MLASLLAFTTMNPPPLHATYNDPFFDLSQIPFLPLWYPFQTGDRAPFYHGMVMRRWRPTNLVASTVYNRQSLLRRFRFFRDAFSLPGWWFRGIDWSGRTRGFVAVIAKMSFACTTASSVSNPLKCFCI